MSTPGSAWSLLRHVPLEPDEACSLTQLRQSAGLARDEALDALALLAEAGLVTQDLLDRWHVKPGSSPDTCTWILASLARAGAGLTREELGADRRLAGELAALVLLGLVKEGTARFSLTEVGSSMARPVATPMDGERIRPDESAFRLLAAAHSYGIAGGSEPGMARLADIDDGEAAAITSALLADGLLQRTRGGIASTSDWSERVTLALEGVEFPDREQEEAIGAASEEQLLVIGPPGYGKTHVLQRRIATLVASGILPTRILVISLTRVAVFEVRHRVREIVGEIGEGVQVRTLHSLAGRMAWELSEQPRSYDGTIDLIDQALQNEDERILEKLARYDHILVDEAQDLVGNKAALALRILERARGGWTVFMDRHQAIYGFEDVGGREGLTFADEFHRQHPSIRTIELKRYYRSAQPDLILDLAAARMLLDRDPPDLYLRMYGILDRRRQGFLSAVRIADSDQREDTLMLHRSRAGVLKSSYHLRSSSWPHRIRMGGVNRIVPAWVALSLNEAFEEADRLDISRDDFLEAWATVESDFPQHTGTLEADEAWTALLRVAGMPRARRCDITRVAGAIRRGLAADGAFGREPGTMGPVVGTVHGSKGREAPVVGVYLPRMHYRASQEGHRDELRDEARILYVAMSRAQRALRVSSSAKTNCRRHPNTGRVVATKRGFNFGCELGRKGELDTSATIRRGEQATQDALAHFVPGEFRAADALLMGGTLVFEQGSTVLAVARAGAANDVSRSLDVPGEKRRATDVVWHDVTTMALPLAGDELVGVPEPWIETRLVLMPVFTGTARWEAM